MLSLYVYTNRKSGKILHTGHLSACPLPKSVHSWEPEGWERPPEDRKSRKSVPAERLRPHLLHLPALRPVLPPGADCPPADGNVPHQVLQPQSQRLQRTRWTDSFVYLLKRLFTCQKRCLISRMPCPLLSYSRRRVASRHAECVFPAGWGVCTGPGSHQRQHRGECTENHHHYNKW